MVVPTTNAVYGMGGGGSAARLEEENGHSERIRQMPARELVRSRKPIGVLATWLLTT